VPIRNHTGLVGFLLALSTLGIASKAQGATDSPPTTVEARLSRLSQALRERSSEFAASDLPLEGDLLARGWADGRGNRGWVDGRRGGWVNGHGGSFVNSNPWRNGWLDRGGFFNHRPGWLNGGSFLNRR
jgi:rSAM-associated Gly-rich repeat protein